ncbi:hypothetical protein ABEB36_009249 [Hypothenemus hampei]|uniref:Uncharacterized protein n=1 Tax=Hypothenemus hampei TaxID=57062 RepID=A0ABD1EFS7_HYPHA
MASADCVGLARSNSSSEGPCKKCKKPVTCGISCFVCGTVSHNSCASYLKKCCGVNFGEKPSLSVGTSEFDIASIRNFDVNRENFLLMQMLLAQTLDSNKLYADKITYLERELAKRDTTILDLKDNIAIKHFIADGAERALPLSPSVQSGPGVGVATSGGSSSRPSTSGHPASQSYARIAASAPKTLPTRVVITDNNTDAARVSNGSVTVADQPRGNSRRFRPPIIGEAAEGNMCSGAVVFNAAKRKKWLHVFRVCPGTSCDTISTYIKSKFKIQDVSCSQLSDKPDVCSFKVCVNDSDLPALLDSTQWPKGIAVREFLPSRNKPGTAASSGNF